jgi:hypothetical protein
LSRLTEVSLPILVKLGSIAVHVEEMLSPTGHDFDKAAIRSLLDDPEVKAYLATLDAAGFLPKKRVG